MPAGEAQSVKKKDNRTVGERPNTNTKKKKMYPRERENGFLPMIENVHRQDRGRVVRFEFRCMHVYWTCPTTGSICRCRVENRSRNRLFPLNIRWRGKYVGGSYRRLTSQRNVPAMQAATCSTPEARHDCVELFLPWNLSPSIHKDAPWTAVETSLELVQLSRVLHVVTKQIRRDSFSAVSQPFLWK